MAPFPVKAPEIREYNHGIVDSANRPTLPGDLPERWENGVVFVNGEFVINGICYECDQPLDKSDHQQCSPSVQFLPYLLEFGVERSTPDESLVAGGLEAVTRRAMQVGSSARIENLMSVGCTGTDGGADNPTLADGVSVGTGTAAVALGLIIQSFYDADTHIGAQGTIYMNPTVAVAAFDLFEEKDGVLRTKFGGHKVIVGNFPDDVMYGHTGDVDLYLSEVFVYGADDSIRNNNIMQLRVERVALAVWNTETAVKATVS